MHQPRIAPTTKKDIPEASVPILAEVERAIGAIPALFATIARSPAALSGFLAFDGALRKGSLSPREVEVINLHVSELNGCAYCVSAHAVLGQRVGLTGEEIDRARSGASNEPRETALLALSRRVVRTGGAMAGAEVARAREAGISDGELIEALAHVALKHFTNAVGVVAGTPSEFPKPAHAPEI